MRGVWARALMTAPVVFASACAQHAEAPKRAPLEVSVQQVALSDVPVILELVGTIDGLQNAEIRARTPGYIEKIHYKEGTSVKTGDLLFTIDPILAQASVTEAVGSLEDARAALFKAEADITRVKTLAAQNAVSKQDLDNAMAAHAAAKARLLTNEGTLQSARANLSYTKVTSPIDGVAGLAKVRVGNLVGQSEPTLLTTVSTLDPVRVRFSISEQVYLKLADRLARANAATELADGGVKVRPSNLDLILADGRVHPHKGSILVIDRQIDISTGTLTFEASFPNPNLTLRPGQFAKVRGQSDVKHDVILLPQRAVRELQGGYQVGVVGAGDKVEIRSVIATERVGPNWVIEKGLKAGERVIIEGLLKTRPGDVVKTKEYAAPALAETPTADAGEGR
jgi:membrane fusion protein (multidrug efflux system)